MSIESIICRLKPSLKTGIFLLFSGTALADSSIASPLTKANRFAILTLILMWYILKIWEYLREISLGYSIALAGVYLVT